VKIWEVGISGRKKGKKNNEKGGRKADKLITLVEEMEVAEVNITK